MLKVLDTELPRRHLICNTEKTQRVHVCRESEEWKKTKTLGALLGEEQDVTRRMSLAGLAFCRMYELFAGVGVSLELKTSVALWLWDMGANHIPHREAVRFTSWTPSDPSRISLAKAHK